MVRRILATIAVLGAMSACAGPGNEAQDPGTGKAAVRLHADRVKEYRSISELKGNSSLVVRAVAGDATTETLNGLPVTITQVTISRTRWGKPPADTLSVLQYGDEATVSDDLSQVLRKGSEYILFLKPFQPVPGADTGRFVITGEQGAYVLDSRRAGYRFAGGGHPQLPDVIPYGIANGAGFLAG